MKSPYKVYASGRIVLILGLLVMFLAAQSVEAREIAGVTVPETVSIADRTLVLNGAGIRKKFFVKVYVGALYLNSKLSSEQGILSDPGAKRITMNFLYREVSAEKLVAGWNEGFSSNNSAGELQLLQERINQFNSYFTTVRKGDEIRLDYIPGQGTRVYVNDQLQGSVNGEDFSRALLKIWLGKKPADAGLKEALLGNAY